MNFPRPQAKEAQTGTEFYRSSGWLGAAGVAPALFLLYSWDEVQPRRDGGAVVAREG